MHREASLPKPFDVLIGKISFVQQVNHNEYSGTCPNCGGGQHPNGDWPDRFRMFVRSKYGTPLGWCRSCGYVWTPKGDKPLSQEEMEAWRLEQIEVEKRRKVEAEKAIELLQSGKLWEQYHAMLDDYAREEWEKRGISDFWMDYWQLGYNPSFVLWEKVEGHWVEKHRTPTLAIPIWGPGWTCINIRHRLLNPLEPNDKYRPERAGLPASMFICDPDFASNRLLIVEGEIKSMVTYIAMDDPTLQVIGLPGKTSWAGMIAHLQKYDPIYICLDPDAYDKSLELSRALGKRCRLISLTQKIDDAIVEGTLDKSALRNLLKTARLVI